MDLPPTRRLTPDDAEAWAALLADAETVDRTGRHTAVGDLAEELADEDLHVEGAEEDGRLVAVSTVMPRGESEGTFRVHTGGVVRPSHRGRGIATALTRRSVDRAVELAARRRPDLPALVNGQSRVGDDAAAGVLQSVGMHEERWTFAMRMPLSHLAPGPGWPAGYRVRGYDDDLAEPLRLAHNRAFDGHHPGFTPWSEQVWRRWVTGSRSFRGDVSFVALAGDEIAGYVVVQEPDGHTAATGRREAHVSRVGTLPEHRGRGVAGALLGHTLRACAAAGYDDASLHVDAENPTGALAIYRRTGFEVETTWTTWTLRR